MATATCIIRSPAVLFSCKGIVSDQKTASPFQIPQSSVNRRSFTTLFASLYDGNNINDESNKITEGVGLEKLFDDSQYDGVSKDSPLLPRPLTSSQSSNTISDLRVASQGVSGAYSEAAAEKAYPNCEPVPWDQLDAVFDAVEKGLVDRAVLPIEKSLGGSIHRNYDLLLRHSLHIVEEVKLAVHHCLVANHGVRVEDLKRVLSHPQHVASEKLKDTQAVASSTAAYGLNILAEDIGDDSDNVTRFLTLAREPIIPGVEKPFKTSIIFSLEDVPGVLFKALAVFALRQINLTKIESRPLRNQPFRASDDSNDGSKYFDYRLCGLRSIHGWRAQDALRHLKEFATFLRVLGSYPVDTTVL
ncbi:Arogenate dehydratase/prephenate dehydratase 2 [Hibiscus syriacus]|uniref:Arogenate dehydratase n=1 Tax=Hibiscus syriacus TaxID=106335 RepID=A0A6A2ZML5_HIBSY|nr:Arogenate dehydratase/prephenate dehydratase 2 [Hibiscus syriacus]